MAAIRQNRLSGYHCPPDTNDEFCMTRNLARQCFAAVMASCLSLLYPSLSVADNRTSNASDKATVLAWCDDLGRRLRSVSAEKCRSQPFQVATERTSGGRALVWRDIPANRDKTNGANAPRVLVIGGIHGDELSSISIVFRWLEWIDEANAGRYHWRVIPASNPDGLLKRPSTRANGRGVDLNRNFATPDWASDAQNYWIKRTGRDPRRYPGESPASEIETRWLQDHLDDFRPDVIISLHAPFNLLDYDGPAPQPLRFGRLALNRLGVYPGSLGNYGGHFKQIPVVTIELPSAGIMPTLREQRLMWDDMLTWMGKHIQSTRKP